MKIQLRKKTLIGAIVLLTALPSITQSANPVELSSQELSDWRYPAILCRDAVLILTLMMELEKMIPGGTDLRWEIDSREALSSTAINALQNKTTYDNVFDREILPIDSMRSAVLAWKLYFRLKGFGYKLVDNEKLPIDAFDFCVGFINPLLTGPFEP